MGCENYFVRETSPARLSVFVSLSIGFLLFYKIGYRPKEICNAVAHSLSRPELTISGSDEQQVIALGHQVAQIVRSTLGNGIEPTPCYARSSGEARTSLMTASLVA